MQDGQLLRADGDCGIWLSLSRPHWQWPASLQHPKAASGPIGHTANSDCRDHILRERPSATWVSSTQQLKSKLSPKGQKKLDQAFVLSRL